MNILIKIFYLYIIDFINNKKCLIYKNSQYIKIIYYQKNNSFCGIIIWKKKI